MNNVQTLMTQLLETPSVSGDEETVLWLCADWLRSTNVQVLEVNSAFCAARLKGKDSSRCLILNGHLDTVPGGDTDSWSTNPWKAVVKDGKMYGLGSSDMKSGVAGIMSLAAAYQTPPVDLILSLVSNEEVDGSGSQAFLEWFEKQKLGYKEVNAIIAEPTDLTHVGIGHRGNWFVKLVVKGQSGHASLPQNIKHNTFDYTEQLITQIEKLESRIQKDYKHPELGVPTIGITGLMAGDVNAPNKIAGSATLQLDIRTTPSLHKNLTTVLKKFAAEQKFPVQVIMEEQCPAGWTGEEAKIRQVFKQHLPKLPHSPMLGAADLCFFTEHNIPCVIYGPGQKGRMHAPDEYVILSKIPSFVDSTKQVIEKWGES